MKMKKVKLVDAEIDIIEEDGFIYPRFTARQWEEVKKYLPQGVEYHQIVNKLAEMNEGEGITATFQEPSVSFQMVRLDDKKGAVLN